MKKYKNIIFVFIFILLCFVVFTFNFLLNPYDIKQYSKHNFDIIHAPAHLISVVLKQSKNIKYKHVVLGASNSYHLFRKDFFLCKTHEPIARLIVPGYSVEKLYEMLKYFLDMHPEVENVYVSLELYAYVACNNFDKCEIKNTSILSDIVKLYFSAEATSLSFNKLRNEYFVDKNTQNANLNNPSEPYFLVYPRIRHILSYDDDCLKENIKSLKKIKDLLDSRKINSTFFIPPANALYLADLYVSNNLNRYENLKRAYSDAVPFYDMAFINEYTKLPIGIAWKDVLHMYHFYSMDVYNLLVYKDNSSNIAMYVDKENIESVFKKQRESIIRYVNENKAYVDNFIINGYSPFTVENDYTEKIYVKDVPKEYADENFCPMQKLHQIEEELGL